MAPTLGGPRGPRETKPAAATVRVYMSIVLALVTAICLISVREWILLIARKKAAELRETPPTWLPDYALAEGRAMNVVSLIALSFGLLKELSGEAAIERAQQHVAVCPAEARGRVTVDLLGGRVGVAPLWVAVLAPARAAFLAAA